MVYDHEQDEQVVMDFSTGSLSRNGVPMTDKEARAFLVDRIRYETGNSKSKIALAIKDLGRLLSR